ncbi:MAG: calcium-binding protein, partial [Kiloniellales bacterium]
GLKFLHMFDAGKSLLLEGVQLADLHPENFAPISDAHLQQDLSAALAWEDGSGLVRANTVYIRSHEEGLEETVDFDPATDKISFFYLSVRGDGGLNFSVEETADGVRFYSPLTGQSMTLRGVSFSELDSSHFEWRANQLEDNIAGRMGLSDEIDGFEYVSENVFSGKSVAMAGLVDRAPYHSQPEYTGTPIGEGSNPEDPGNDAGSTGNDSISGSSGDDLLRGLSGDDLLYGDEGRDQLRGQDGDDTASGGSGNDSLFGGNGDDLLIGDTGNDQMVGGEGSDVIFGDLGRDRLNGAAGTDTAYGGQGNDTFIIDTETDRIFDGTGEGSDVLLSNALDYTLGTASEILVERVQLNSGAGAARMIGNANDDLLIGNAFDNGLRGLSGDDRLNSQGGTNTMTGGSGDDTFIVTTADDRVRELNNQGTDLVRAKVDYTLPDGSDGFIENLRMQGGFGNIDGAGNNLDNTLEGNTGANRLSGLSGDDRVQGWHGDDLLYGGSGEDRLDGESGNDTLFMESGDAAFGGSGMDSFLFDGQALGSNGADGPVVRDLDGALVNAGNGADKLVFATGLEAGNFAYLGAAAFSGGGNSEARFAGPRQIEVDQDGDGAVDQAFLVDGVTAANLLTATDFVWL